MGCMTYSNLGRDQVTLVQNENKMLVWCFLLKIFLNRSAACSQRITGVQNMQDDIGGIYDLVCIVLNQQGFVRWG